MHFSSVVPFLAALALAPPGYGETTCGALCQNTVTSTVFNFIGDLLFNDHECKDCGTLKRVSSSGNRATVCNQCDSKENPCGEFKLVCQAPPGQAYASALRLIPVSNAQTLMLLVVLVCCQTSASGGFFPPLPPPLLILCIDAAARVLHGRQLCWVLCKPWEV
jgi:hypothetical protein